MLFKTSTGAQLYFAVVLSWIQGGSATCCLAPAITYSSSTSEPRTCQRSTGLARLNPSTSGDVAPSSTVFDTSLSSLLPLFFYTHPLLCWSSVPTCSSRRQSNLISTKMARGSRPSTNTPGVVKQERRAASPTVSVRTLNADARPSPSVGASRAYRSDAR